MFSRHWWNVGPPGCADARTEHTAVVVAADPADEPQWRALLLRLAATDAADQIVVGRTDDADAVVAALVAGAGGWMFGAPGPAPSPTRRRPHPRWYEAQAADGVAIRLSAREVAVLQAVADGHTLTRIARDLGLSTLTVRNHITRAGHRLGARSRSHMVLLALRSGVIV